MSETLTSLRRKRDGAADLQSVVRTMKAIAAANIGQYENAVRSLADYYRTVELGLAACFRQLAGEAAAPEAGLTGAIVFGSDQGLAGQFNEVLVRHVTRELSALPGDKTVWAVGERIRSQLTEAGIPVAAGFAVPNSVNAIAPLVGQVLVDVETRRSRGQVAQVYVFHNHPRSGASFEPGSRRLLPLDKLWRRGLDCVRWPTVNLPEVIGPGAPALLALIREYLFVSLFKACAESLASENASRLAAMQRAERNIGDLLQDLSRAFHCLRQSSIDEELFDLISGFEALGGGDRRPAG